MSWPCPEAGLTSRRCCWGSRPPASTSPGRTAASTLQVLSPPACLPLVASDSWTLIPGWSPRTPGLDQKRHSDIWLCLLPLFPDQPLPASNRTPTYRLQWPPKPPVSPKGTLRTSFLLGRRRDVPPPRLLPPTRSGVWLHDVPLMDHFHQ